VSNSIAIVQGSFDESREKNQVVILLEPRRYTIATFCARANVDLGTTVSLLKHEEIDGPTLGAIRWQALEIGD
jgi:hypothetical protein